MLKKLFLSGCFGLFLGITISTFFNYINNLTVFHIIPHDNSLKTTTLAFIIYFIVGVLFHFLSFLYNIEKIPLLFKSFIHVCLSYFIIYFFFNFFLNLNIPIITFIIPYIFIWIALYYKIKANIKLINEKLKNNNNKSDEK